MLIENFCTQLFRLCRFRPMLDHTPTITDPLRGNLASRFGSFQLRPWWRCGFRAAVRAQ